MTSSLLLGECTREVLRERLPGSTVVVPVAAVEQHGPHLPVLVDTILVENVARRAAELAVQEVPVLVAPVQCYGSSHHHLDYVALSLRSETLSKVLWDLGDTLARVGARRVFFLNGHGGNESVIDQAVRDLSLEHDALFGAASYWKLAWEALRDEPHLIEDAPVPGHAGWFETATIMAVRPDLVDHERLPLDPRAVWPRGPVELQSSHPVVQQKGWMKAFDGFTDDARGATAEKGEALLQTTARAVAQYLIKFHRMSK